MKTQTLEPILRRRLEKQVARQSDPSFEPKWRNTEPQRKSPCLKKEQGIYLTKVSETCARIVVDEPKYKFKPPRIKGIRCHRYPFHSRTIYDFSFAGTREQWEKITAIFDTMVFLRGQA